MAKAKPVPPPREEPEPEVAPPTKLAIEPRKPRANIFEYASVDEGTEDPPAKFFAPLPTNDAALSTARPAEFVELNLDQPQPLLELVAALNEATRKVKLSPALRSYYAMALGTPSPARCISIGGVAQREKLTPEAANALRRALSSCGAPALAPLFEESVADDDDVIAFYASSARKGERLKRSPRFLLAAQRVTARSKQGGDVFSVSSALRSQDGFTSSDLKALMAKSTKPDVRSDLASAFLESDDEALARLASDACKKYRSLGCSFGRHRPAIMCGTGMTEAELAQLTRRLNGPDLDECARAGDGSCLEAQVRKSRAAALTFFTAHPEAKDDARLLGVVARTLAAYPNEGDLFGSLVASGLLTNEAPAESKQAVTIASALRAAGRAPTFSRSPLPPIRYDLMLTQLSRVTPGLERVFFAQVAPPDSASTTPYELQAFLDGKRFSVTAANTRAPDVAAIVGFLNTLSKHKQSDLRFVPMNVPRDDGPLARERRDDFAVLIGPAPLLEKLVNDGLVPDYTNVVVDAEP